MSHTPQGKINKGAAILLGSLFLWIKVVAGVVLNWWKILCASVSYIQSKISIQIIGLYPYNVI